MIIRGGRHEYATGRGNSEEPHPWESRASDFISYRMSDLQKPERQNLSGQQAKIGGYQKAVRWVRGSGLLKVDTFRKKPTLHPDCHPPPVQTPQAKGGQSLCPTSRVGSENGINTSSALLGKNCHTINWTWVGRHSAPHSQVLHCYWWVNSVGFPRGAFWSLELRLVACHRQQNWNRFFIVHALLFRSC